jgi:hypothetical protein
MTQKKLSEKLAELIDKSVQKYCVPIQKGNSVRIKHTVIRTNKHNHLVIDLRYNKQIGTFFSKTGAVACAVSNTKGDGNTQYIVRMDRKLQEKYLECLNYKRILENSDEEEYKQTATIRYQIAWEDLNTIKQALLDIVFDK